MYGWLSDGAGGVSSSAKVTEGAAITASASIEAAVATRFNLE
jgi:hypothetical protein